MMEPAGQLTWKRYENTLGLNGLVRATATLVGGYVYVNLAGWRESLPLCVFSLATQKWKKLSNMPTRYSHSAVLVEDKLYLIGGRRTGDWVKQIEEIDLLLETSREVKETASFFEPSAGFIERRGEIIICGNGKADVYGFNVYTEKLTKFKIAGSVKPLLTCATKNLITASNGDIIAVGHTRPPGTLKRNTELYVLKLVGRHHVQWSQIKFNSLPDVPQITRMAGCAIDDLVVLFGGFRVGTSHSLYLWNTRTKEHEELAKGTLGPYKCKGPWPEDEPFSNAVVANNHIWFFGTEGKQIFKLRISPR